MIDWPRRSESFCAIGRATMSVPPPAAKGMTQRMGFTGYAAFCAPAPDAKRKAIDAKANRIALGSNTSDSCVTSLAANVVLVDDLLPARRIGADERGESFGLEVIRLGALRVHQIAEILRFGHRGELALDLRGD